jgi:hypothetical protein
MNYYVEDRFEGVSVFDALIDYWTDMECDLKNWEEKISIFSSL